MKTKVCNKCGEEKPVEEYYADKTTKDRLRPECKSCHNVYTRTWRKKNPDYHKKWRKASPEKVKEYNKNRRAN